MSKRSKSSPSNVKINISTPSLKRASPKKSRPSSAPRGTVTAQWLKAVMDPFNHEPVSVPDEQTSPSVKYISTVKSFLQTRDVNAVPSTTHGLLVGISPLATLNGVPAGTMTFSAKDYDSGLDAFTSLVRPTITTNGTLVNGNAMFPPVSSSSASTQTGYLFRCTAIEARLMYLGTELNRAGMVTMGIAEPLVGTSNASGATISPNPLNRVFGDLYTTAGITITHEQVVNRMRRCARYRTKDGAEVIRWIPTGSPSYCPLPMSVNLPFSAHADLGPEIIIEILDDVTTSPQFFGNSWSVEVMHHYEVIPQSRQVLCVPVTPSHYDPQALAICLNAFQKMQSSYTETDQGVSSAPDGHQTTSGTSWEYISRAANAAGDLLSNPTVQRVAVNAAMHMSRAQQRPSIMG